MKRKAIINILSDAPETWNAEDLARLETATGERVTRDELRAAHDIENSATIRHTRAAISESMEKARGAEFSERLEILLNEVLPAVKFEQEQRERLERLHGKED